MHLLGHGATLRAGCVYSGGDAEDADRHARARVERDAVHRHPRTLPRLSGPRPGILVGPNPRTLPRGRGDQPHVTEL